LFFAQGSPQEPPQEPIILLVIYRQLLPTLIQVQVIRSVSVRPTPSQKIKEKLFNNVTLSFTGV